MEVVVLGMAVLSPWAFGGVDPVFELILTLGLVILLGLWVAVAVVNGRFSWLRCSITACLGGIFLLGVVQLVPLPAWLLSIVSPGTARFYDELLPKVPEQLTSIEQTAVPPRFHAISVYPHATRTELFRWLSVILLFAVVRNQLASTASLKRLALALTINGALLAIVGIVQMFSSNKGTVYWTFQTQGQVFGPFINRNHFAAYLNVCIALGTGLLLLTGPSQLDRRRSIIRKPNAPQEQEDEEGVIFSPLAVLHAPAQLWTCVALALMLCGLVCSLSRGGLAALLVAVAATLGLRVLVGRRVRIRRLEFIVLPVVLVLALLAWLNVRPLETRLGSILRNDPLEDGRWQLWLHLLSLVPRFPVFGTGYGTIPYVEPTTRWQGLYLTNAAVPESNAVIDHAHNDYLEALAEGGLLRFGLTLLLVGLVFAQGFRAMRRFAGRSPGAYAFAGMLAFLAVALHAAVDFSLSTPAVAILATVVVAQLVSLNRADPTEPVSAKHHSVVTMRLGPPGRVVVATAALLLGGVLFLHAWQADRVHRLRIGAYLAMHPPFRDQVPSYDEAVRFLTAATEADPDDADLQLELGQVYLEARQNKVEQRRDSVRPKQRAWAAFAAGTADVAAAWVALREIQDLDRLPKGMERDLFDNYVIPGLRHMALARRACPLLARPHVRFAAYAAELPVHDPPGDYLARACSLAPFDADLWYFSGLQQLRDGKPDVAWKSWRRSLELSERHLGEIIDGFKRHATKDPRSLAHRLIADVLPDNAQLYLWTILTLDPDPDPHGPLQPLMERGLSLCPDRTEVASARDYYIRARFYQLLGRPAEAQSEFGIAANMREFRPEWRQDYINFLIDQEKWAEAVNQLKQLKATHPFPGIEKVIERIEQKAGRGV
jgi:O-antigen ligase